MKNHSEHNAAKGGKPSDKFSGSPETFQSDSTGTFTYSSFPQGWFDTAQVSPDSTAPQPSAVVIKTTDAFGHSTKALATLPDVADSQGIYRPIESSHFYKTQADVRVDQFSDVDRSVLVEDPNNPGFLLCGCPVGAENVVDWPMQVGFVKLNGDADPSTLAAAGLVASAETHTWQLFAGTQNTLAVIDLGIHIQEGKWYGVETDFDAKNGILHGVVTDIAKGITLADKMVFLQDPKYAFLGGTYDPKVDGVFNAEAYIDGEHTLTHSTDPSLTRPGLAVIDNIDSANQPTGHAYGHGSTPNWLDGICSDHG